MNQEILNEITQLKRKLLPNEKLILFGAQARGDAKEDSEWNLLVLLNNRTTFIDDEINYAHPFKQIGLKKGIEINVWVYSINEWERRDFTPFYKKVQQEGIEIN